MGPIPVLTGEVEYVFSDQSIRVNYFSNFKFGMFGSSKYEGTSIEYSFNEIRIESKSNKIYIAIGKAEKRDGSNYDENYQFIELGYEKRYFRINKGLLANKYWFMRYYLSHVEEEDLSPFNTPIEDYLFPGFSMGIGF